MAKPSLSDLLSAPSLLKAAVQADAINESRMVGDRSVGALLEASQKLGKPPEELSYRSESPFAEAAKFGVGAGAATLMLSNPVAGKMLGRGLLYGLVRKGIERNDEAFNRDDLSSYDQALQMLPILYAADPGAFMRGIEGVRHISSIAKQRNPLSAENIRQRQNSSAQVMDKDGRVLKTYRNAVRVIPSEDVSTIDPARIIESPTSAIAKVPVQKGAYQSALAKLVPPEGGGAASSSAIRALISPYDDLMGRGLPYDDNVPLPTDAQPATQAPESSDRWFHPRWDPNEMIEAARESRERSYIIYPDPPDKPSTQMSANPSDHSRRFVTMTGSGKEYDIDEVLTDAGWNDWVTKHVKPISHSEYYSGLNSDEFINKLNENIAKLNKSKTSYVVQKSPSSASKTWLPSITATYPDGSRSIGYPYFQLTPGAVDIPTGLEGLPEHFKVASYFDSRYPGLNAVNTMMGGILNPSETGGGTHFYEALAKTLRETGKGNLRDGRNSKSEHSFALWEKIKPDKGFSFYNSWDGEGSVGGGFNSVVPLIPGLLGLMGQKEERDGSSNK